MKRIDDIIVVGRFLETLDSIGITFLYPYKGNKDFIISNYSLFLLDTLRKIRRQNDIQQLT